MFEAGNWDVEDVLREQFGLKYVVEPLFVFLCLWFIKSCCHLDEL